MLSPRVLIALDTRHAWSRGVLRGFAQVAHERGWTILPYCPDVNLNGLNTELRPDAAVLGPGFSGPWPVSLAGCVSVSVNCDRSGEGIASVLLDEARTADLAFAHLHERGVRNFATFRLNDAPFAVLRESRFTQVVQRAGAKLQPAWWSHARTPGTDDPAALLAWLTSLERPCGIFACCDPWARVLAHHARAAHLRVPEELALIGVDNDPVECELMAPPLSSVAVPWHTLGASAANLVLLGARGRPIAGKRVLVAPSDVVVRRSSNISIPDPLVAAAVAWIHEHAHMRVTVPMVATAVGATRQRLERRIRQALGRTVLQEIRRAHVEVARRLLSTTELSMPEIARRSGFTSNSLLSVAFSRELGTAPSAYRRRARRAQASCE